MKHITSILLLCLLSISMVHGKVYQNFRAASYVMVQDINRIATVENWEREWAPYAEGCPLDKIYLETYRDEVYVNDDAMKAAIKFFRKKGIEVQGGITYNYGAGRQRWESFCYSNPKHHDIIRRVAELTARYFDEIVLDDYYFTNCKCLLCIDAKGDRSWGEYRCHVLDSVAHVCIVDPAHKVNPKCKVIVKYPNWYDHFHGLGFDLEHGPYTFDGMYTGTETRDPRGEQHLQRYESFSLIKYLDNLRPGHNMGGWVDTGGCTYPRAFHEQLWFTLFAKSPEITIWNFSGMARPVGRDQQTRWLQLASEAFRSIDPLLGKLGHPKGLKAYKPFQSEGEDFLHNYLGMVGVPVEIVPQFPADEPVILLTECAKYDPQVIDKMKAYIRHGGNCIVTSGFYRAMQEQGIRSIFEMTVTGRSADIDTVSVPGLWGMPQEYATKVPIRIPCLMYHTNDSWEFVTGLDYDNGWPIFHHSVYGDGNIYVWTIPDNFSHLYALPAPALDRIRQVASTGMPVRLLGPSRVTLFTYDNGTFVVHNVNTTPATIRVAVQGKGLTDLLSGETLQGSTMGPKSQERVVEIQLEANSFKGFKISPDK